jgi:hypothetical protein
MGYKAYLYLTSIFFLMMVASGILFLLTWSSYLVVAVVVLFFLALISIQLARRSARKQMEKVIRDLKK